MLKRNKTFQLYVYVLFIKVTFWFIRERQTEIHRWINKQTTAVLTVYEAMMINISIRRQNCSLDKQNPFAVYWILNLHTWWVVFLFSKASTTARVLENQFSYSVTDHTVIMVSVWSPAAASKLDHNPRGRWEGSGQQVVQTNTALRSERQTTEQAPWVEYWRACIYNESGKHVVQRGSQSVVNV